jgi:hypothetical protein
MWRFGARPKLSFAPHRGVKVARGSFSSLNSTARNDVQTEPAVLTAARRMCGYEVITAVTTKRNIMWDPTPCLSIYL